MTSYDNWLLNQAEKHNAPCEPRVVAVHLEPQDGEDFNDYPEMQAEMDEAILWGI